MVDAADQAASDAQEDRAILATIATLEGESYGFYAGDLAAQRAEAIRRYLCEPYGDEVPGRSQVVSSDLRDVIEWIIPQWLRVCMSGDQVAKFSPDGPGDEQAAEQETKFVNHVILERNDALTILSTWGRDALMSKNGYVKAFWEERADVKTETYRGLTDDALAVLMQDKGVEIVEHAEYIEPAIGPLHDAKVRRTHPGGQVRIENIPPEEIMVHKSVRGMDLQTAIFVQHRTPRTLSEVRMMGYDVPDTVPGGEQGYASSGTDNIYAARDRFEDNRDSEMGVDTTRVVWLRESYIRSDVDGDGVAELRRVVHIDNLVLANEECDLIPIAAITPIIFPHRHIGVGYDDLVKQQGLVKTALMRQGLDNLYLSNNGRYGVDVDSVNIDDLLVSRPGGVVRTRGNPSASIFPLVHPQTFQSALQGMEWVDSWRENSTGISAYYQGMNADALNKTASGISQVMSASQQRVEAVIRSFANGFRDLCYIVHALTLKNAVAAEKLKVSDEWVTIDPREWVKRTQLTVTVGLGTGTRELRIQQLMTQWQIQMQGLQMGITKPENLYQTGKKISEEMGYRNATEFWSNPAENPPQPPAPPPEVMVQQMKQQGDMQQQQVALQADALKFQAQQVLAERAAEQAAQLKRAEMEMTLQVQAANDQRQSALDQQKLQIEMRKLDKEYEYKMWYAQQELAMRAQESEMNRRVNGVQ